MDWDWELCESAENDDLEKVKKCLANGADINAKGEYICTALGFAETDETKAYLEQAIKQKEFIDFAKQGDIEKIRECLTNGVFREFAEKNECESDSRIKRI